MIDTMMRLQKVFLSMLFIAFFLWGHFLVRAWIVALKYNEGVCNPGGPFGIILPQWLFVTVSFGVVIFVGGAWWRERGCVFEWSWLLILVGGLGNLLERVLFGCIIDYIALPFFPVFNFADILLTIGTLGIIVRWRHSITKNQESGIRN